MWDKQINWKNVLEHFKLLLTDLPSTFPGHCQMTVDEERSDETPKCVP